MRPDALVEIKLLRTDEGGRAGPTAPDAFGCLLVLGERNFDCRIDLSEWGPLLPGQTACVPVSFLDPRAVLPLLRPGSTFAVRDGKIVGSGRVLEILAEPPGPDPDRLLPEPVQEQLACIGEHSYGAHKVTVTLDDGREFEDCYIAWGKEIVRVGKSAAVPFDARRVVRIRR